MQRRDHWSRFYKRIFFAARAATCGSDWVWLIDDELPTAVRSEDEFEIGGTASEPTVRDTVAGLEWRRCLEGTTWNGLTCDGAPTNVPVASISTYCDGDTYAEHSDWRVPDVTELGTLLEIADLHYGDNASGVSTAGYALMAVSQRGQ